MSTAATPASVPSDDSRPETIARNDGGLPTLEAVGPLGFGRLVAVEFRKLLDTAGGRGMLVAIFLLTVLPLVLLWFVADAPERDFRMFLETACYPLGFLLPVLGVLTATQEWTQRTGLVTFTQEPRRVRVALAKVCAGALLGLASVLTAIVLAALFTLVSTMAGDVPDAWSISGWMLGGNVLALLASVLSGLALGFLLPVTWVAIVAYYVLPVVLQALSLWGPAEPVIPWIVFDSVTAPLKSGQSLTGEQWQHFASALGVWVVLPLVVGIVLMARREVK